MKELSVSFMKTMKILMKIYLKKSKLPSLKIRRLRTIAVETFKIIHKQSPSYLHDLISIKDQKYNFRHQDKAVLPRVRTTRYGLNSFRYNAAQIWNELPNRFRQETSLEHFLYTVTDKDIVVQIPYSC
jgi:hypothetical protein